MGIDSYPNYCVFRLNFDGLSALFERTCLSDFKHISRPFSMPVWVPMCADTLWSLPHAHLHRDGILDRHPRPPALTVDGKVGGSHRYRALGGGEGGGRQAS